MTEHFIAEPCTSLKDGACVDVCPVDAIGPKPGTPEFETAPQLFINPAACIGCGSCRRTCPVAAIFEIGTGPEEYDDYVNLNEAYFQIAPAPVLEPQQA